MSAKDNKEENKNIDVERLDVEQQVVVAKYCTLFRVPEGKNINEAHHYKVMDNTLMVKWNKDDDFQEIEPIKGWDVRGSDCRICWSDSYLPPTEVGRLSDYDIFSGDEGEDEDGNGKE